MKAIYEYFVSQNTNVHNIFDFCTLRSLFALNVNLFRMKYDKIYMSIYFYI